MTCEFTIDGVIYRLTISRNNRIYLAIIGVASPAYRPEHDPFDWDYVPSVTVLRTAYRQLVHWVGETRPPFFIFPQKRKSAGGSTVVSLLIWRSDFPTNWSRLAPHSIPIAVTRIGRRHDR